MIDTVWPDVLELGPKCQERYINLHNKPELAALNIQASGISTLYGHYRVARTNKQSHTLIYTVGGEGTLKTEQGVFTIEASTLITIPAGTPFLLELNSATWQTVWFELQDYPQWHHVREGVPLISFNENASAVYHLLALIDKESNMERLKKAIYLLASYLSETDKNIDGSKTKESVKGLSLSLSDDVSQRLLSDVNRLNNLFNDIDNQLHYPWSVDKMASLVHYSSSHFHRLCLRYFDRSPLQQLIYLRIQRAKYLLRHTQWSIAQIASHVGYQDIYNFSKRFSKSVGQPPARFRVNNRVTNMAP